MRLRDPDAVLAGAVHADSRCGCGAYAETVVHSPLWGLWDVCRPCGERQVTELTRTEQRPGPHDPGRCA